MKQKIQGGSRQSYCKPVEVLGCKKCHPREYFTWERPFSKFGLKKKLRNLSQQKLPLWVIRVPCFTRFPWVGTSFKASGCTKTLVSSSGFWAVFASSCISGPRLRSQGKEIWVASSSLAVSHKILQGVLWGPLVMVPWQVSAYALIYEVPWATKYEKLPFVGACQNVFGQHPVPHRCSTYETDHETCFPNRHCNFEKKKTSDTSCLLKNAKPREVFLEESTFFSKIKPLTFDYFPANVSSFSSPLSWCEHRTLSDHLTKLTKTPLKNYVFQ